MVVERVKTGIPGFDPIIEGGLVKNSITLLSGSTGTGKTILGCHYLWSGLQAGENVAYITLEERVEDILADVERFGWDFKKFIDQKKAVFEFIAPKQFMDMKFDIFAAISKVKATRVVIDNLSLISLKIDHQMEQNLRQGIFSFFQELKKKGTTPIIIVEIPEGVDAISRYGLEEFMADGVIVLNYLKFAAGGMPRSLAIRKMRRTMHGTEIYPFEISPKGIVVKKA